MKHKCGDSEGCSFGVLGPGAVGGFLAVLLSQRGYPVTCVGREEGVRRIGSEGLRLESRTYGDIRVHPRAVTRLDEQVKVLFITTKATGLSDAVKRVPADRTENMLVVPLLNGIEHMDFLRSHFGSQIVAGSIGSVELKRLSPNHIFHSTPSCHIHLASDTEETGERVSRLAGVLSSLGISVKELGNEKEILWGKLVRLNALACTTAATNKPIGILRSDPEWRGILEACVREGSSVAVAEGVPMDPQGVISQIESLPHDLGTSMQRDVAEGRVSELDAIAGAVVRAGARYGIECPTIQSLIGKIQNHAALLRCDTEEGKVAPSQDA
jgi:2-dehydropantoate 2-reductase